jgi:N-acetyl-gamma-glutamyl-phosphate reductase
MQSTMYVKMADGVTVEQLRKKLVDTYANEPFVRVLEPGVVPHTRHVRGSNFCFMNVFPDRLFGRAIVISVIDNLVKGASGQAMQVCHVSAVQLQNLSAVACLACVLLHPAACGL